MLTHSLATTHHPLPLLCPCLSQAGALPLLVTWHPASCLVSASDLPELGLVRPSRPPSISPPDFASLALPALRAAMAHYFRDDLEGCLGGGQQSRGVAINLLKAKQLPKHTPLSWAMMLVGRARLRGLHT